MKYVLPFLLSLLFSCASSKHLPGIYSNAVKGTGCYLVLRQDSTFFIHKDYFEGQNKRTGRWSLATPNHQIILYFDPPKSPTEELTRGWDFSDTVKTAQVKSAKKILLNGMVLQRRSMDFLPKEDRVLAK